MSLKQFLQEHEDKPSLMRKVINVMGYTYEDFSCKAKELDSIRDKGNLIEEFIAAVKIKNLLPQSIGLIIEVFSKTKNNCHDALEQLEQQYNKLVPPVDKLYKLYPESDESDSGSSYDGQYYWPFPQQPQDVEHPRSESVSSQQSQDMVVPFDSGSEGSEDENLKPLFARYPTPEHRAISPDYPVPIPLR